MFTGIIQQLGTVKNITPREELSVIEVACNSIDHKKSGDSISIDGACFTIVKMIDGGFITEAMPETLSKTICGQYTSETKVNLENPLKVGDELNGHFVSGHVDTTGKVLRIKEESNTKILRIGIPASLQKFCALKGSITINGVSLTLSGIGEGWIEVSLIPETIEKTNLGTLSKDDKVNLEIDLISRYLDSIMKDKEKQASYEFLQERGFL